MVLPPTPAAAGEDEPTRLYRTREERREAGQQHVLTPWLTATALLEGEFEANWFDRQDGAGDGRRGATWNLQLGLTATPLESVKAELILEYDSDIRELAADEATAAMEDGPWELSAGRLYTPFGTYLSHFASGPLLEFGETRATGIALAFSPGDALDLSLTAYRGRARREGQAGNPWDYALALESWPTDNVSLGVSYQTDLADASDRPLEEENDRYAHKVGGLAGYLLWSGDDIEASAEALGATGPFQELEPDRDRPLAWNLELAVFPLPNLEWALRLEGSRELADAPGRQHGLAVTWRASRHARLTLEYLRGDFRTGLAGGEDGASYKRIDHLGLQVSLIP